MNTKSILIFLSLAVFTGILGLCISWGFKISLEFSINLSLSITCILFFAPLVLKRYKNRQNYLDVLLEISSPIDWIYFIAGVAFAISALLSGCLTLYSFELIGLIPTTFYLLLSLNCFISGTKFQENGLMVINDFIEWKRIESYSWVQNNSTKKYILSLKYKRQVAFLDFGVVSLKIKMMEEDKNKVETIFEKYLPGKLADS